MPACFLSVVYIAQILARGVVPATVIHLDVNVNSAWKNSDTNQFGSIPDKNGDLLTRCCYQDSKALGRSMPTTRGVRNIFFLSFVVRVLLALYDVCARSQIHVDEKLRHKAARAHTCRKWRPVVQLLLSGSPGPRMVDADDA